MLKKLLSIVCAASIVSSAFISAPATASAEEPVQLTYMDGETEFSGYTYTDANTNVELNLDESAQLGTGTVEMSFQMSAYDGQCGLRAGMEIAGETIYINANDRTYQGDWPASDGYHLNYLYRTTADVTYTITLDSEGNATKIDCLLIDSEGTEVFGKIEVAEPQSISQILLKSASRSNKPVNEITISNFNAEFTASYEEPSPEEPSPEESETLTYMYDTGDAFTDYTYTDGNTNVVLTLGEDVQLGAGTVEMSFKLKAYEDQCNYRAGMEIAGETIYINANAQTDKGNWPATDGAVGYHLNYLYSTTADVTYTITLDADGNATKIDCLLIDSNGVEVSGEIEVEDPQPINEISLKSDWRSKPINEIAILDFNAVFITSSEEPSPEEPSPEEPSPENPTQLTYMDGETEFSSYIYENADPNKTLTLNDDVQWGEGTVTITFDLDSHTAQCNYRAGMKIASETIYINANTQTNKGDWPANSGAVGYHLNYLYSTTADVTYTITLNSEGKATKIDCLLVDGNGVEISGQIDVATPDFLNEISLKSAQRGGSQQITLSNFKAEFDTSLESDSVVLTTTVENIGATYGMSNGEEDQSTKATGFVATVSGTGTFNNVAWLVTSSEITKSFNSAFDTTFTLDGGNCYIGMVIDNLYDAEATATAEVSLNE